MAKTKRQAPDDGVYAALQLSPSTSADGSSYQPQKLKACLPSGKAGSQNYWSLRTEFEPGELSTLKSLAININ